MLNEAGQRPIPFTILFYVTLNFHAYFTHEERAVTITPFLGYSLINGNWPAVVRVDGSALKEPRLLAGE